MSENSNFSAENSEELNNNNPEQSNVPEDAANQNLETPNTETANSTPDEDVVNKLLDEVNELKDKLLRKAADFENYKRRTSAEFLELRQTAAKEVIVSMLDVLDDCNRAEQQINNTSDATVIKEGVQLVFNKLRTTLTSKGVKALESIGEPFDTELHEAITEIPAPTPDMAGKVIDEVQKGYYLGDKLIRFAKVVVGKAAE
jgi:molecular chaperone GrpE